MPAEMVDAIRTLPRLERFATNARAVGEWSLVMDSVQMEAAVRRSRPTWHHLNVGKASEGRRSIVSVDR
jgi:hypothetical protein